MIARINDTPSPHKYGNSPLPPVIFNSSTEANVYWPRSTSLKENHSPSRQFRGIHTTSLFGNQPVACPNLDASWLARVLEVLELRSERVQNTSFRGKLTLLTGLCGAANGGTVCFLSFKRLIKPHSHHLRHSYCISIKGLSCYTGVVRTLYCPTNGASFHDRTMLRGILGTGVVKRPIQ